VCVVMYGKLAPSSNRRLSTYRWQARSNSWRLVMKKYQNLKQEIYDLDAVPPEQQSVYEAVWNFYKQAPDWDRFTQFWLVQMDRLHPQLSRKDITETPLFKSCEDLDARVAINQGYTCASDYRDELQKIIEQKFPSRYAFCQTVGLDEGYLC